MASIYTPIDLDMNKQNIFEAQTNFTIFLWPTCSNFEKTFWSKNNG